jgi:hypothetical protein
MPTPRLRLRSIIGRSYNVDPDDTRRTKIALRDLGYFDTPSFGITPYPDEPMFQGIEEFQDDFDLRKDGMMKPNGETARKLTEVLELKDRTARARPPANTRPQRPAAGVLSKREDRPPVPKPTGEDRQQVAVLPVAIPVIVYEIAMYFGMSVAAAYAWWISRPAEEKRKVRAQIQTFMDEGHAENPSDTECEALLKIDSDTCRQISKKRGKQAGARCYATAMDRYGACLAGKPKNQWPPLDTWNN